MFAQLIARCDAMLLMQDNHSAQLVTINNRLKDHNVRLARVEMIKEGKPWTVTPSDGLLGVAPAAIIAAPGDGLLGVAPATVAAMLGDGLLGAGPTAEFSPPTATLHPTAAAAKLQGTTAALQPGALAAAEPSKGTLEVPMVKPYQRVGWHLCRYDGPHQQSSFHFKRVETTIFEASTYSSMTGSQKRYTSLTWGFQGLQPWPPPQLEDEPLVKERRSLLCAGITIHVRGQYSVL